MSDVRRTDEIQGEILHVYDGIEEADNSLPTWWLLTFYGAIAFGLAYWFYYQVYGAGQSQRQIFDEAVAAAEAEKRVVSDESLNALALDASAVSAGSEIFATQCVACHGTQGQGMEALGPNLTDAYWIHGGAPVNIHNTVTNGIAAKGMPPWGPILGEEGVNQVVAHVLSLRNTNVEGEPPQGEIWPPEDGDGAAGVDTAGGAGTNAETGGAGGGPGEAP
ncbi:MAG: cbb3-type cytochrome c oxidase N-terminal domain-containing protein [Myxococcota bacterium]